jgi:hypothetical protein
LHNETILDIQIHNTCVIVELFLTVWINTESLKQQKTFTEVEFLNEIQIKVFRVFLLAIHSHQYSCAVRFLFLQTHAPLTYFCSSVTAHCKGERRKS